MSLIADALNKLKKEREELGDDRISAPPSLRNAIVNSEKYKEFVKRTEMRDSDGKTPNIKGFIAVSIIIVAIIIATVYVFLKDEKNSLVKEAGIVKQTGVTSNAGAVESLGKPYTGQPYVKPVEKIQEVDKQPAAVNEEKNIPQKEQAEKAPLKTEEVKNEQASNQEYIDNIFTYNNIDRGTKQYAEKIEKKPKEKQDNVMPYNNIFFFGNDNQQEQQVESSPKVSSTKKADISSNSGKISTKIENSSNVSVTLSKNDSSMYRQYISDAQKCEQDSKYSCAIENYKKAYLIKNDENLSAVISLLYIKEGNSNLSFQNVVTSGMTNPALIKVIALLMTKNKDYNDCRKLLQYANTLDKSNHILFANGYYYYDMKNYEDAVKYFVEASEDNKNDALSYLYAGYAYKRLNNKEKASQMFQNVLNIAGVQEDIKNTAEKNLRNIQQSK